jgi:hypothetical protein
MPDRSRFFFSDSLLHNGYHMNFSLRWARMCSDPPLPSIAKAKYMNLPSLLSIYIYMPSWFNAFEHRNYFTLVCCMLNLLTQRLVCAFKFYRIVFMNKNYSITEETIINTKAWFSHSVCLGSNFKVCLYRIS